ncbi:tandem-95 repeat protein [Paenibacillus rhizovicinus]|uniref:Tandem-95 repeat protein n=1 Tax=Paenibacillus rhizovicinus TaxID=2704463 RepID=A0A6C0P3Y4_9BACL|nr:Ig-like domain-containing protein [Paenibacillus rhizovicinus]QHW31382.1 tandem-95 repeat protein [Paenibacillus rhizovicinus]
MLICFLLIFGMLPQMKAAAASASLPGDQSSAIPSGPVTGLAYGNGTFVGVGYYGKILRSDDGRNWQMAADKTKLDVTYTSVTFGNGVFVAVGYEGAIMTSPDGWNWTQQASPVTSRIAKVDYVAASGINQFFAVTAGGKLLTSSNGAAWIVKTIGGSDLTAIASNGSVVVIGDAAGHVHASSNGTNWTDQKLSGSAFFINSILSLNGRFYANDPIAGTLTSTDGLGWYNISLGGAGQIFAGLYDGNSYYLFGYDGSSQGGVFTSAKSDGVNFARQLKSETMTVQQGLYAEGVYVEAGNDGVVTSTDGSQFTYAYGGEFTGVVYNGAYYIAAGKHGNDGIVMTSPDFVNWTPLSLPLIPALKSIAYGGGRYVAVSDWPGSVIESADGVTWGAAVEVDQDAGFSSVAFGNGVFVAVDEIGSIYRSTDSASGWNLVRSDAVNYYSLRTVSYSAGLFYAVGDGGTILQSSDGVAWTSAPSAPSATTFNKYIPQQADIPYSLLNSSGFTLLQVSSQGSLLQAGTDYTFNAGTNIVTFSKSYLAGLDNGWHSFDFHLSNQVFERLAVNVTNTAPALPQVTGATMSPYGTVASWNSVANAVGYDVQMYRNGSVWGGAVSLGAGASNWDFQAAMLAGGPADYKVKVTAKGDIVNFVDGPQSAESNLRTIFKTPTEDGTADKAGTTQHANFNIVVNATDGASATAQKSGVNVLRSVTSVAASGGKAMLPIDIAKLSEGANDIVIALKDGAGNYSEALTVSLTRDTKPVGTAAAQTTNEDTALNGTLGATVYNIDGTRTATFAKASEPAHGTLTVNGATGAYTYTPASNYFGSDSFIFTVNDGAYASAPATVSITVNAVNDAPTAAGATETTAEDTPLVGTLIGADVDTGSTLTFAKATDPVHGTLIVNSATGAYTYTPASDYNGSDSFTFTVSDGVLTTAPATVNITVTAVNDAPTGISATDVTDEDTVLTGTLHGSDIDTAGSALTFVLAAAPVHGEVSIDEATGDFTYTPASNYNGNDSFTFRVNDGVLTSAPATFTIGVNAVNDAPTAEGATETTAEGTPLTGMLVGADVDTGSTLTFANAADPAHGTLIVNSATGAYTYTPASDYNGSDSFTFTVSDGTLTSAPATIDITVIAVNNAPTGTPAAATTDEDTALTGTLTGTDVDTAAASLTFAKAADPAHGTLTVEANGAYTYTPASNYNGSDSFTFTVSDGEFASVPATISITVNPVNDAPAGTAASETTAEDTALSGTLTGTDAETAAASLTFAKATDPEHGTLTVNSASGAYTYTPDGDYSGSDSFTFTVSDGELTSAPATISITVTAINDAPTATAASETTAEDTAFSGTLSGTDVDTAAASLTFAKAADPAHGTVTVEANGAYTYTPNHDYSGSDSFTFTVSDGAVTSAPATIGITVNPVNDAPAGTDASATTAEDTALSGTLSGTDAETAAASLTFAKATDPEHGEVTVDETTGAYTYTPASNYNGSDSFTFTVSDGALTSDPATISITVTAVNDAPSATAASATTAEDKTLNGTLTGTDPDTGATLTFAKASEPAHGTVTINETTGAYTYKPAHDYNGKDSFDFTVSDGTLTSAAATVSITVKAVSESSNDTTPTTDNEPSPATVEVFVNGKAVKIGTATTANANGRSVTTISVDAAKLEELLADEGLNAIIKIAVAGKSDVVVGELNGQTVQLMKQKQSVIKIQTTSGSYVLPAEQIDMNALSGQLGQNIELKDIKLHIEIAKPTTAELEMIENAVRAGAFTLAAPPLEFTVKAVYGDKSIEVSKFNGYVERIIALPEGVDPSEVTTAIAIDSDGTLRHVPTQIVQIDGKYYAKANSLTNSIYAVVAHAVTFTDVEHHWAKDAVNDMGSRMIISGIGNGLFSPDRDITRAEFAAIMVRGLGLKLEEGANSFSDVKVSDWYSSAVNTAYANKLINGFEDGKFHPMDKITREQAMAIIAKAMEMTGLRADDQTASAEQMLHAFTDVNSVAAWAQASLADCLQAGIVTGRTATELAPKANMTRAEVAAIVQRLLKKSDLI